MTGIHPRIGDLSREAGINAVTLHYFETAGLPPEPARRDNGQRLHGFQAGARLRVVRQARVTSVIRVNPPRAARFATEGDDMRARSERLAGPTDRGRRPDQPTACDHFTVGQGMA